MTCSSGPQAATDGTLRTRRRPLATSTAVSRLEPETAILLKPARLTTEEFEIMKGHARIGGELLGGGRSPVLQLAREIALTHHERWDGTGYPSGLASDLIPLVGRIVSVADVFDALTHTRPYKEAWPIDQAVLEICDGSGRLFDPTVIDAFQTLDHDALIAPIAPPHSRPQPRIAPTPAL